jgi:hypothetical protein
LESSTKESAVGLITVEAKSFFGSISGRLLMEASLVELLPCVTSPVFISSQGDCSAREVDCWIICGAVISETSAFSTL